MGQTLPIPLEDSPVTRTPVTCDYAQSAGYLAHLSNAQILDGLTRILTENKKKRCKTCGRETVHATCDSCQNERNRIAQCARDERKRPQRSARTR